MVAFSFPRVLIFTLLVASLSSNTLGVIKFTNIKCEAYDAKIGYFAECQIQAISRVKNSLSIDFVLNRTVDRGTVHFQFFKRASGWRPFLYNMTTEPCKVLKNPTLFSLPGIIYRYALRYTNINHSCPFLAGEHFQVKSFVLDVDDILKKFPADVGEYAMHTKWYFNGNLSASINGSAAYTDYSKV